MSIKTVPYELRGVDGKTVAYLGGGTRLDVVGEYYRQDHVIECAKTIGINTPTMARLRIEPENAHDANAVALDILGGCVGYIPKTCALDWNLQVRTIEEQTQCDVYCYAEIFKGKKGNKATVEVFLMLPPLHVDSADRIDRLPPAPPVPTSTRLPLASRPLPKQKQSEHKLLLWFLIIVGLTISLGIVSFAGCVACGMIATSGSKPGPKAVATSSAPTKSTPRGSQPARDGDAFRPK